MGCFLERQFFATESNIFHENNPPIQVDFKENLPLLNFKTVPSLVSNQSVRTTMTYHEVVRVLSYNILADAYLSSNFSYCEQEHLEFSYRGPRILRIISALNPHVICLQEVDHYNDFYQQKLQEKYELFHESKGKDGILIGFQRKSFKLLRKTVISYQNSVSEEIFQDSSVFFQERFKKAHKALIIDIESLKTKEKYIIANTHLHWDPMDEDVKQFQSLELLRFLENRYNRKDNLIICGDFNSLPDSPQIQMFLKTGFEGYDQGVLRRLWQVFQKSGGKKMKFRSSYSKYRKKNQRTMHPSFTNYTANFKGVLDYILYNGRSDLRLKKILKLPKKKELHVGLPNKIWPSDHLPIISEFYVEKDWSFLAEMEEKEKEEAENY